MFIMVAVVFTSNKEEKRCAYTLEGIVERKGSIRPKAKTIIITVQSKRV